MPPGSVDDPLLGTEVGPYRLVELLGRGGMGRVYLGVHPEIHARVAIKVISEDAGADPDLVERFFAEARAVNMISHDGIVRVHDLVRLPGNRPAIVMELVDGRTLRDLIHAGPISIGGAVQVMIEVLGALAAAHAIGIVHRDLKPDNIIISDGGRAKVLDFGIAKLAAGTAKGPRTRTGALLGTPHYMSPEQIQGTEVDARSDLYSLGVVLFELFTGQRPFDGATDFELMMAQVSNPPPSLRALRPELPKLLEDVVLAALAKRKVDRFGSANAMANALHSASEGLAPEQWRSLTPHGRAMFRPSTPPAPFSTVGPAPSQSTALTKQHSTDPGRSGSALTKADRPMPRPPSRGGMWIVLAALAAVGIGVVTRLAMKEETTGGATGVTTDTVASARRDAGLVAPNAAAYPAREVDQNNAILSVDYDPRAFDPQAYLPRAQAAVRAMLPDPELTLIRADMVNRAGLIDLGTEMSSPVVMYRFRSRSRSAATVPADQPKNVRFERRCEALLIVAAKYRALSVVPLGACDSTILTPRCTIAEVWSRAIDAGAPTDELAALYLMDQPKLGQFWNFTTPHASESKNVSLNLPDDCGVKQPVAKANPYDKPKPDEAPVVKRVLKPDDVRLLEPGRTTAAGPVVTKELTWNTGNEAWTRKRDYSIGRFDAHRWRDTAESIAHEVSPGAQLVAYEASGVMRNGALDLDPAVGDGYSRTVFYDFASATAPCSLRLVVNSSWAIIRDTGQRCVTKLPASPRCSLVGIWERAVTKLGIDGELLKAPASIQWNGRSQKWSFDLMSDDRRWGSLELDDRCP